MSADGIVYTKVFYNHPPQRQNAAPPPPRAATNNNRSEHYAKIDVNRSASQNRRQPRPETNPPPYGASRAQESPHNHPRDNTQPRPPYGAPHGRPYSPGASPDGRQTAPVHIVSDNMAAPPRSPVQLPDTDHFVEHVV